MKYYVTTSIPYVNGEPHIGHAMELIQADVLARYARSQGDEVVFSTGTDEHGLKIAEKAADQSLTPKQLADQMAQKFRELCDLLNISNDRFVRTTDPKHEQSAQKVWQALGKDMYKASYRGWYDVRQEEFVPESKADPARMKADHPQAYRRIEEENYFFRLSAYTDKIRSAIESGEFNILPATRRNEVLSLLNDGLEDISISRPTTKLDWGIPVPGDDTQVMYVWFEALMNYITVLGYPDSPDLTTYWPADVQVIGKDIIRFHAAIWPAMLMGLGLALPKTLYVHGFINVEGQKMSKSIGNVIAPADLITVYGVDAFRYYFLRHVPAYEDGDFSWDTFRAAYNNELANELGNSVQRTAAMINRYQEGKIGPLPSMIDDLSIYQQALGNCQFDKALDDVWERVRKLNQYIDEEKPWLLFKQAETEHLQQVLAIQVGRLLGIASLLEPFMPETAQKINAVFASGSVQLAETTLFPKQD